MQSKRSQRALEMFALVERYYNGTATQKSFCETEGLKLATFQYWISRYKKSQSKSTSPQPGRFVELQPALQSTTVSSDTCTIELRYPNGVTLSLAVADTRLIKELIQL